MRSVRESLVAVSRRYSRVAHEVEDLAHDILVSALRRGPLDTETLLSTVHGAARRHGAFLARSASRRRAREARVADHPVGAVDAAERVDDGVPLSALSPALQTTLHLLLSGLEKAELRYTLGLSDAALRKRFQALRESGPLARPAPSHPNAPPASPQLRRSQVELLPRLATARACEIPGARVLAVSDPDGHGIIFAEVLTPGRGTATPSVSAEEARTAVKGTSC